MAPDERKDQDEQDAGPGALADDMEREADRLEQRSQELGKDIEGTRQDWESKQADPNVPGAVGEPGKREGSSAPPDTPAPGTPESEEAGQ